MSVKNYTVKNDAQKTLTTVSSTTKDQKRFWGKNMLRFSIGALVSTVVHTTTVAFLLPTTMSAGATHAATSCGNRYEGASNRYHYAKIQRQSGGVQNGKPYITYQIHYAVKPGYRDKAVKTTFHPTWTNYVTGKEIGPLDRSNKSGYYYHMSVRVAPGGMVGFEAHTIFDPPHYWLGLPVLGTSQVFFSCKAE